MSIPDEQKRRHFEEEALVHLDALHGLGLRLTGGDEARAEDLVREAFLKAYRTWEDFELGANCRAWLMATLRDAFVGEFRKEKPRPARVAADDAAERSVRAEVEDDHPEGTFRDVTCEEALSRVYEYLDGELDGPTQDSIHRHLEVCRRCYPRFDFERVFLDFVRERGLAGGGDGLRERVLDALEREG